MELLHPFVPKTTRHRSPIKNDSFRMKRQRTLSDIHFEDSGKLLNMLVIADWHSSSLCQVQFFEFSAADVKRTTTGGKPLQS